jgi:hypothetical protein
MVGQRFGDSCFVYIVGVGARWEKSRLESIYHIGLLLHPVGQLEPHMGTNSLHRNHIVGRHPQQIGPPKTIHHPRNKSDPPFPA